MNSRRRTNIINAFLNTLPTISFTLLLLGTYALFINMLNAPTVNTSEYTTSDYSPPYLLNVNHNTFSTPMCGCETEPCPVPGNNHITFYSGFGDYDYILNANNVPVVVSAFVNITRNNLNTGTDTTECTKRYAKLMNDDPSLPVNAGHIFAKHMGGSGDKPINIFPQNPKINSGIYAQFESKIYDTLYNCDKDAYALLKWEFVYSNENKTRPDQVTYYATFGCQDPIPGIQKVFGN